MSTNTVKPGDKVRYTSHRGKIEKGIVKAMSTSPGYAFVVYNCHDDWDNYQNYTALFTDIDNLMPGWEEETIL